MTWKDQFWTAVCDEFEGVTLNENAANERQYEVIYHEKEELQEGKVFKGEPGRLNIKIDNQKPYVAHVLAGLFLSKARSFFRKSSDCYV